MVASFRSAQTQCPTDAKHQGAAGPRTAAARVLVGGSCGLGTARPCLPRPCRNPKRRSGIAEDRPHLPQERHACRSALYKYAAAIQRIGLAADQVELGQAIK